ncbi:MAG TPA: hypothetical protein VI685_03360 [Candidatus Angelobacter sp.]
MRSRTAIVVALILLMGFILCLPVLEFIDYNDLILTGQDLEVSVLNMLTIFAVWFVLILRLLAVLPSFQNGMRRVIHACRTHCNLMHRMPLVVLFLPDESSLLCGASPLLI